MTGTKRVLADQCCGAIIDYQDYFLAQLEPRSRARLSRNMGSFTRLLAYMRIPTIVTLERPVDRKGVRSGPIRIDIRCCDGLETAPSRAVAAFREISHFAALG